jgi:purine-nucleoside phosphorylase
MSIHIEAKNGEIAESILLPGDPLRAAFIAESLFENPVCFNKIRGMLGFTGIWNGHRVSVMGTGMGMPSHSIYVNELLREYGVKRLVRVGTCGSIQEDLRVRDIVLAMAASTDSNVNRVRFKGLDYASAASFDLVSAAYAAAGAMGIAARVGSILSSDSFYADDPETWKMWARYGILAVEMETAELYTLAAKFGAQALSILTVSDSIVSGEATSSAERQTGMRTMAELALRALTPFRPAPV